MITIDLFLKRSLMGSFTVVVEGTVEGQCSIT